ncbi:MAG TPA: antibiotic biosynthesis monooxygenase family protein [Terriglobales bacterium]|nr:antibiotic biosynthesis monooxygenase family protein [Terriglobales bacterium]
MIVIVWEFRVAEGKASEFERHYGPEGTWVRCFRKGTGYRGTELVRDTANRGRYLTLDRWESLAAYQRFKRDSAAEYESIDAELAGLSASELLVGIFETVG